MSDERRVKAEERMSLLAEDIPGLVLGGDPEALAREHPHWADTITQYGPWSRTGALRLGRALDETSPANCTTWLSTGRLATKIFLCAACSSALDVGWRLWDGGGLRDWDAVIAARQWAGRGQVRRPWTSLPGNLHVVWRAPLLPDAWSGLASLVQAWLAVRTLSGMGLDVRIKWPNDLLLQDRKIGGILVEQRGRRTLVGLGLNLFASPEEMDSPAEAKVPAAALKSRLSPVNCWDTLVSQSVPWYQFELPHLLPKNFITSFSTVLAWRGRHVLLHEHGREDAQPVLLLGVSETGGLIVSQNGVERTVHCADIRPAR